MSTLDTKLVGWIWASAAVAIVCWLLAVALVLSDVFGGLADPVPALVLHVASCATIAVIQLLIAHATRRPRRDPVAAATTIEMPRIPRARGRVPVAAVVGPGAALHGTDRDRMQLLLAEADRPRRLKPSEYFEVYSDVVNDLGTLNAPPEDDDEADDR